MLRISEEREQEMIFFEFDCLDGAEIPRASTVGSAGLDLFAYEDCELHGAGVICVKTGVFIKEITEGYCGLVCSRSGLAVRHGLCVLNAPGIIDSDYRGEIKVILYNTGFCEPLGWIRKGQKIAQIVIIKHEILWRNNGLPIRKGGFGSTGY